MISLAKARVSLIAGLYLIAATAPRVAAFLLLPVYAFVLSPDELAAYGVAIAMVQLIGIVSEAGILGGVALTYWEQPEADRPAYLKSVLLLSRVVALAALLPIGIVLAMFWDPLFGSGLREDLGLPLLLAFAFLLRGNNLAGAVYRFRKQHRSFAMTRILPALIQVAAGLLFVFVLHWGSLGALTAAPLGFLISIVVVGLRRSTGEHVPFVRLSFSHLIRLVTKGAPLMPEQLARWAQMLSLRPLMAVFTNARETAQFTFANAPAQIVSPFSEAYEQYIAPRYYESAMSKDTAVVGRLRDVTSMFLAVGAIGSIVAIVLFDPVFLTLAPAEYKTTAGLAAIGLAGMMLRGPMALLVHNLRVEDRRVALVGAVAIGTGLSYLQFFVFADTFGATSAAWCIYLYPAIACTAGLLALGDPDVRLVAARDFVIANLTVLVVLLAMLTLRDGGTLDHFWILALTGLVGIAIIGLTIVRPRLASTMAVVRGGVTRPHEKVPAG